MTQLSFSDMLGKSMTQNNFVEVIESDRKAAANYARKKGMVKATIEKYLSGKADSETLLQTLAEYRISLTSSDEKKISVEDVIAVKDSKIEELINQLKSANQLASEKQIRISKLEGALSNIRSLASRLWFGGKPITDIINKNL